MEKELTQLIKKIESILKNKQLPSDIKEMIASICQETFNEDYMEMLKKVQDKYEIKCQEKAEVITIILSTLESQKNKRGDEQIEKSEIDILNKCVRNEKENSIIIDIIRDYIRKIKIEGNHDIKFILEEIKQQLDADDKKILEIILNEYQQYRENEGKTNGSIDNDEKNFHQKFVDQYRVSEEDLIITKKEDLEKEINKNKEKEYEELPGDVIE